MLKTALLAAALVGSAAQASAPAAPSEARIRQMAHYLEAVADPGRGVFIRAYDGQWYYARTQDDCARLTHSAALRFEPSPGGYFDRNSAIRADGWRCLVASVTHSDGPRPHHR